MKQHLLTCAEARIMSNNNRLFCERNSFFRIYFEIYGHIYRKITKYKANMSCFSDTLNSYNILNSTFFRLFQVHVIFFINYIYNILFSSKCQIINCLIKQWGSDSHFGIILGCSCDVTEKMYQCIWKEEICAVRKMKTTNML